MRLVSRTIPSKVILTEICAGTLPAFINENLTMNRFCLASLRFCLCAWVGVAMFFVVSVLDVLDSLMNDRPPINKFSHPDFFLPRYFGFAAAFLGAALLCAFVGLWNARVGLLRRWAIFLLVVLTVTLIAADRAFVYEGLVEMFGATQLKASTVVTLFQFSRLLKGGALAISFVAAFLALCPEKSADVAIRRNDPAL